MVLPQDFLRTVVLALSILLPGVTAAEDPTDGPAPAAVEGATYIDTATARQLLDDGIPFVDVRPGSMYQAGRIQGAISLPLGAEFNRQALAKVAGPDDPVVLHCRGKDCLMSSMAARQALTWGYSRIYYYRAGYNGWKENGHPVEVPPEGDAGR
ncbi:MAG: rhodanese-like domain-containing protein [Sedimenticola sp.]